MGGCRGLFPYGYQWVAIGLHCVRVETEAGVPAVFPQKHNGGRMQGIVSICTNRTGNGGRGHGEAITRQSPLDGGSADVNGIGIAPMSRGISMNDR